MNPDDTRVQFEDSWQGARRYAPPEGAGISSWIIKYSGGRIKDTTQANILLLVFVLTAVIVSLVLFFGGGGEGVPTKALKSPEYGLPQAD